MLRRTLSLHGRDSVPGAENLLRLNLPMKVEGRDAGGSEFEETAVVEAMSHATAVFDLRIPVVRGNPLRLAIDLPPKLAEDKDLRLIIRGTIETVERSGGAAQRVSLKLDSKYVITPAAHGESAYGRA